MTRDGHRPLSWEYFWLHLYSRKKKDAILLRRLLPRPTIRLWWDRAKKSLLQSDSSILSLSPAAEKAMTRLIRPCSSSLLPTSNENRRFPFLIRSHCSSYPTLGCYAILIRYQRENWERIHKKKGSPPSVRLSYPSEERQGAGYEYRVIKIPYLWSKIRKREVSGSTILNYSYRKESPFQKGVYRLKANWRTDGLP